ncbi:X-ray repair cross-complementing protein 5-like [Anopheles nili]|uniref:X-ray repair cross-complementing protein 5-like n=1 Tax=Anopheles nili TaxID=185578 RepID=UPI00237AF009|nr:X-ray repair cross-complementing protein 5-like [Anopheles nili]
MARSLGKAHMIILDVGRSSSIATGNEKQTFFSKSKECASLIIQQMIFSAPNDQVGMVLMGTEETNNQLNVESGGYEHICEAFDLKPPNWQNLRILENQISQSMSEANWFDALIVATNFLRNGALGKKLLDCNIILISPLLQPAAVDRDQIDSVTDAILALNGVLHVITNYVLHPASSVGSIFVSSGTFDNDQNTTEERRKNERLLKDMLLRTEGTLSNVNWAERKLSFVGAKPIKPTPWNCMLTIGSKLKLSISAYLHITEQKGLGSFKVDSLDGSSTKVEMKTEHFLNDKPIDVSMDDIIAGYMYGSTVVPYDCGVDIEYKSGEARLACLGFTASKNVQEEYLSGQGTHVVVAKKGCTASKHKLAALIRAMMEMDVIMITTKVYRKDTKPRLNAMIPSYKQQSPCLVMIELIFKDELCELKFPSLLKAKTRPTEEQYNAIDKLIDSMSLTDEIDDSNGESREAFALNNTFNPTLQHVYRSVAHRALYPKHALPLISSDLRELTEVPKKVADRSKDALETVQRLFELKEVKQNTRNNWLQRVDKINMGDAASNSNTQDSGLSLDDDTTRRRVVSVGTVTPAEDFDILLRQGEKFATVATQMQNIIFELLFTSMRPPGDKVIAALMMYRGEAQKLGPYRYNEWIEEFKTILLARGKEEFWEKVIVGEKLGLIDAQESDMSTVNMEQAVSFYDTPAKGKVAEETTDANYIDPDSLLDELNAEF